SDFWLAACVSVRRIGWRQSAPRARRGRRRAAGPGNGSSPRGRPAQRAPKHPPSCQAASP
ncbi:hypothetical protein T484DRAFT_1917654, partial [Baffinella frigidus]